MAQLSTDRVLDALRAGDRIMVTHPDPFTPTGKVRAAGLPSFALVQAGKALTPQTFACLKDSLTPVEDGLFPDEPSQTYRLAD